ncbi:Rieske (2Fe-2S) protein [Natronorubrum tibetense]|uniref:Rieske (2Fe-2S) iron-sulfur domain-containing protein n=1 Tax=Natronorubrum tibetense GA33 TaxID=1114856 RepID=L9VKE8_9EURY|nr:Rieske 2Fe-2S domain-containing protein [Natronorubrum tibetense]ELY37442.1 Rieske (2Fe-2S) iron-sulfur domain-containing protein [Natronorubrum tibetense GA33]
MDVSERIAALEEVPTESTLLFRVTNDEGETWEAILVASDGADGSSSDCDDGPHDGCGDDRSAERTGGTRLSCWLNYCQHLTHIKIDKGSGAPMRDGELVCANHGAYFDSGSGECTHGPCEGAYLTALEITVDGGDVYLTDDEYSFVGEGPIEDDGDLTSTSNVKI